LELSLLPSILRITVRFNIHNHKKAPCRGIFWLPTWKAHTSARLNWFFFFLWGAKHPKHSIFASIKHSYTNSKSPLILKIIYILRPPATKTYSNALKHFYPFRKCDSKCNFFWVPNMFIPNNFPGRKFYSKLWSHQ
jgi:hypothetical protein